MEEVQTIVALGAGSITKRVFPDGRIERCDNVKDVALYIEKIDEMIERKRKLLGMEPQKMIEYRVVEKQLEKYEYNRSTTLWTFRYARNVLFLRV